jgi:hypothetical protein
MGEKRDQGSVPGEPEGQAHSERFEDHLTPEELSAYQAGELTPEQNDAIQEHLAGCELCTEVLLDLHRFLDLPPEDLPREGVADLQTEAEWKTLQAKLGAQGLLPARGTRKPRRHFIAAVAAIFLVAIGLASYLFLQGTARKLTLDPDDSVRGGSLPVPAVQPPIDLFLRTSPHDSYPEYLVVLKREEQTLRTYPHLLRDQNTLSVKIPLRRWGLKPGLYKFEMQGVSGQARGEPNTYSFRVL